MSRTLKMVSSLVFGRKTKKVGGVMINWEREKLAINLVRVICSNYRLLLIA